MMMTSMCWHFDTIPTQSEVLPIAHASHMHQNDDFIQAWNDVFLHCLQKMTAGQRWCLETGRKDAVEHCVDFMMIITNDEFA